MKTTLKSILVFENGELVHQINYRTKKEAIGNYKIFSKHGMLDYRTGELRVNATFELI